MAGCAITFAACGWPNLPRYIRMLAGRAGRRTARNRATRRPGGSRGSELLLETGLLQHTVGGVARLDLAVDRKVALRLRAEPDLMIAVALAYEATAARTQ